MHNIQPVYKMSTLFRRFTSSMVQMGSKQSFSTSQALLEIRKLARMKIIDNSQIGKEALIAGKAPRVIHVYRKNGVGYLGDKVLVTVKGQKKKAYIVGCKQNQKPTVPKFDSNNIVLIEDNGQPTGTRIKIPVPSVLRKRKDGEFTKILSLATKFV